MVSAKKFGMKVTQYFLGFGPTLWSFRRGETEYGVKAIPAGGFVKIIGMTPIGGSNKRGRASGVLRAPVWKRTIVLSAGSFTHFVLGSSCCTSVRSWPDCPIRARAGAYDAVAEAC